VGALRFPLFLGGFIVLSVFDLAFHYIERFYEEEPSTEEKREILERFEDLFAFGWTIEGISKVIKRFMQEHPGVRPDIAKLFSKAYSPEKNLISPDAFYYHNQLRITPGAPKRELDINTGEIKKVEEEYYLEMKASYTIDNLVDYYVTQLRLHIDAYERKKLVGAFKYLLKSHDVESLLFMIDVASNTVYSEDRDRNGFTPFKLTDYRTFANQQRDAKRTENILSGDDKIVPRKRILSFRSSNPV
jgi:hypothetical protein